eukprot:scaffold3519_cov59-Phaeocystis_antarctica.AAC.4
MGDKESSRAEKNVFLRNIQDVAGALKLLFLLIPCLTIPSSISSAPALSTDTGDVEAADVATDVATDVAWLPWLRRESVRLAAASLPYWATSPAASAGPQPVAHEHVGGHRAPNAREGGAVRRVHVRQVAEDLPLKVHLGQQHQQRVGARCDVLEQADHVLHDGHDARRDERTRVREEAGGTRHYDECCTRVV